MSEIEIRITPEEGMLKEFIHTFKGSLDLRLWMSLIQEELVELRVHVSRSTYTYRHVHVTTYYNYMLCT